MSAAMTMTLKSSLRRLPGFAQMNRVRQAWKAFWFRRQGSITFPVGRFDLVLPSRHPLPALMRRQPSRDLCIAFTAKHVGPKYPSAAIIDVGANVGDSAALIASHCGNDLILVEPSDFFAPYVERNASLFPNKVRIEKVCISPEGSVTGRLVHWGGTAFIEPSDGGSRLETRTLAQLGDNVCMIKIDTDGNDFGIINKSLSWFEKNTPALVFEHQVRSDADVAEADRVCENLLRLGYRDLMLFDATGYLMLSTSDLDILKDLNRYQLKAQGGPAARMLSNYDVVALHGKDGDLVAKIRAHFR